MASSVYLRSTQSAAHIPGILHVLSVVLSVFLSVLMPPGTSDYTVTIHRKGNWQLLLLQLKTSTTRKAWFLCVPQRCDPGKHMCKPHSKRRTPQLVLWWSIVSVTITAHVPVSQQGVATKWREEEVRGNKNMAVSGKCRFNYRFNLNLYLKYNCIYLYYNEI